MEKKHCGKCKVNLNLDQFSWKNKILNKRSRVCKNCQRQYNKQHYDNNKLYYKTRNKKHIINLKIHLLNYLLCHSCVDCGEADPVVLEFDHVSGTKLFNIGSVHSHGCSIKKLNLELNKCVVRCANCHKRKTSKQFKWWKHKVLNRDGVTGNMSGFDPED